MVHMAEAKKNLWQDQETGLPQNRLYIFKVDGFYTIYVATEFYVVDIKSIINKI